jgi:hypothetical protein
VELNEVQVVETGVTGRIKCAVVGSELQDGGLAAKCDLTFNNLFGEAIKIIQKQNKFHKSPVRIN